MTGPLFSRDVLVPAGPSATAPAGGQTRPIVVAVDDSEQSMWALDWAGRLAAEFNAPLVVLHALPWVPPLPEENLGIAAELAQSRRTQAIELLKMAGEDVPVGVRVERVLREGPAAPTILAYGEEADAALIVIGTRGRGRLGRVLLGSTAEDVIRGAGCPVLTVTHAPPRFDHEPGTGGVFRRILIAVDESEPSHWAAEAAAILAKSEGARLALLHVEPAGGNVRGELGMGIETPEMILQARARHVLEQFTATPGLGAGEATRLVSTASDVASEVLRQALSWNADLVVVGTSARGRVAELFLGSTAEDVIRGAPCPVLAVRCPVGPVEQESARATNA